MLKTARVDNPEMMQLTNVENAWHRRWCAVLVLFAVCCLTASVATRYTSYPGTSTKIGTAVQKHVLPVPKRQRLIKDASAWMPPVVSPAVFQAPSSYPRIAPAGPPILSLLFEENLYNRPPPFPVFLA